MFMPRHCFLVAVNRKILALLVLCIIPSFTTRAEVAGFYVLNPSVTLGGSPSSLLMQSSFIDVPAGAVLNVHLLKGHQIVSTSKLEFTAAYKSASVFPSQIVSFLSSGSSTVPGEPLTGAKLYSGITDLTPVAAEPGQYQFLWSLSEGIIATPGQAIVTGGTQTVSFVELKLSGLPAALRQSDQKPGSVLFYHRYLSTIGSQTGNSTTISVTNTSLTDSARVRMFFVDGSDCQPIEQAVCLSAQQTIRFNMGDFDPGTTGYCIAIACDALGNPTQFNWLIGHAQIRQTSVLNGQTYDSSLSATAIAKRTTGSLTASNNVAEMVFDDTQYDRLPNQLAADNIPSQGTSSSNANSTTLAIYRPLANLAGGMVNPRVDMTLYNSTGQSSTFSQTISCYGDLRLSVLRFNPTLPTTLPVGKIGWIRLSANDNSPLFGAQFNNGQYTGGTSLRAVTFAAEYRISVPIKAPGC